MRPAIIDKKAAVRCALLLLITSAGALFVLADSGPAARHEQPVSGGGPGRSPATSDLVMTPAGVVSGFPTYPGASWDGDLVAQEADGHMVWLVSWTAPADEESVHRFFIASLSHLDWVVVGPSDERHQISLRHQGRPPLRGYLRFGPPEYGERGTGVTLGLRDPKTRRVDCAEAVAGVPMYPGATVRECDLTHTPGHVNFSLFLGISEAPSVVWPSYTRLLVDAGWHSGGAIAGAQLMSDAAGRTTRLILGPDIAGQLETGMMVSVDLPEESLAELPASMTGINGSHAS